MWTADFADDTDGRDFEDEFGAEALGAAPRTAQPVLPMAFGNIDSKGQKAVKCSHEASSIRKLAVQDTNGTFVYSKLTHMRISRTGIVASVLPSILMLAFFYSLALHMYRSLGGWPTSIGEHGFPPSLLVHANVTVYFFIALICFGTFIWPVAVVVCLIAPRWRRAIPYLALYGLLFLACWGLMQLAPEQFLYWWRD